MEKRPTEGAFMDADSLWAVIGAVVFGYLFNKAREYSRKPPTAPKAPPQQARPDTEQL